MVAIRRCLERRLHTIRRGGNRGTVCAGSARARTGATLPELLAAIPLLALLAFAGGLLVLDAQRTARTVSGHTERARELRHAAAIIGAELRPVHSTEMYAWNDTLLEFDATIGTATACGAPGANTVDVLPASSTDVLRASWISVPDIGDDVALMIESGSITAPPLLHHATIINTSTSSSACTSSVLRTLAPGMVHRFTISPAPPNATAVGAAVRFTRRTRMSLYRASDGDWFLGIRTRSGGTWEIIQPVAGPFDSHAQRGLRFVVRSRTGTALGARAADAAPDTSPANRPAAVSFLLRASSAWKRIDGARDVDSLVTLVSLRNQ